MGCISEKEKICRDDLGHSILHNLQTINFRMRHERERKDVPRTFQFFYNLPPISFRMRHDRERKEII